MAAGLQVSLIFWGWALAQYPLLVPPDLTIANSAAPHSTLRLVLVALAIGGAVLLPSLWYLFQVFKTAPADPGIDSSSARNETLPRTR
jgi:cytochrome bd ubiquinol oxidase subunit II